MKNESELQSVLRDSGSELKAIRLAKTDVWQTEKFQAYYQGLPVVGAEAGVHHYDAGQGRKTFVTHSVPRFDLDAEPTLSAKDAVGIARSVLQAGFSGSLALDGAPELQVFAPTARDDRATLVYAVSLKGNSRVAGHDVWVNAHTGEIVALAPEHQTIAPIEIFEMNDQCQTVDVTGAITSFDLKKCAYSVVSGQAEATADASSLQALDNARAVLEYFQGSHGRDSFDDKGTQVVSLVHAGKNFSNAFWSSKGKFMAYGDGDGKNFRDFTAALDVAGHEMTHGVVSSTANLIYTGEHGALNEAYADFFGLMIDPDPTWAIGKKLLINPAHPGLRDLAEPGRIKGYFSKTERKPYPAHMKDIFVAQEACGGNNDYCYVHANSTIPGHASYLIFQAIGKEKTEQLYYAVLTQFLNARADFQTAAQATKTVCQKMYDADTCDQVTEAFAAVGL